MANGAMTKASLISPPELQTYLAEMCGALAAMAASEDMQDVAMCLLLAQRLVVIETARSVTQISEVAHAV